MQIHASSRSSERAVVNPDSPEEQRTILGSLPIRDSLVGQYKLFVQKVVGRPPELSLSHDALSDLAGNIYWHGDPAEQAAGEVHDGVMDYLAANQQTQPQDSSNPHLV